MLLGHRIKFYPVMAPMCANMHVVVLEGPPGTTLKEYIQTEEFQDKYGGYDLTYIKSRLFLNFLKVTVVDPFSLHGKLLPGTFFEYGQRTVNIGRMQGAMTHHAAEFGFDEHGFDRFFYKNVLPGMACDGCGGLLSGGWSCTQCVDFDLCDACHNRGTKVDEHVAANDPDHKFERGPEAEEESAGSKVPPVVRNLVFDMSIGATLWKYLRKYLTWEEFFALPEGKELPIGMCIWNVQGRELMGGKKGFVLWVRDGDGTERPFLFITDVATLFYKNLDGSTEAELSSGHPFGDYARRIMPPCLMSQHVPQDRAEILDKCSCNAYHIYALFDLLEKHCPEAELSRACLVPLGDHPILSQRPRADDKARIDAAKAMFEKQIEKGEWKVSDLLACNMRKNLFDPRRDSPDEATRKEVSPPWLWCHLILSGLNMKIHGKK